jgi:hypothetical protein
MLFKDLTVGQKFEVGQREKFRMRMEKTKVNEMTFHPYGCENPLTIVASNPDSLQFEVYPLPDSTQQESTCDSKT